MSDELTSILVPLAAAIISGLISVLGSGGSLRIGGFSRSGALDFLARYSARTRQVFRELTPNRLPPRAWALFEVAIYLPAAVLIAMAVFVDSGVTTFETYQYDLLITAVAANWVLIFLERDGLKAISRQDDGSLWSMPAFFYGMISRLGPMLVVGELASLAIAAKGVGGFVHSESYSTVATNFILVAVILYIVVRETFHGRMRLQVGLFNAIAGQHRRTWVELRVSHASPENELSQTLAVLTGIGSSMTVTYPGGFVEEIQWSRIERIAVRDE